MIIDIDRLINWLMISLSSPCATQSHRRLIRRSSSLGVNVQTLDGAHRCIRSEMPATGCRSFESEGVTPRYNFLTAFIRDIYRLCFSSYGAQRVGAVLPTLSGDCCDDEMNRTFESAAARSIGPLSFTKALGTPGLQAFTKRLSLFPHWFCTNIVYYIHIITTVFNWV